ncbi:MAG TPA: ABC-F family ATP-binding cassette domain-containing protein [Actinomycetota bacterium]|nr:ABC-F family ATP-binding cassette domain-containing protein [Actinomycetota bacterium]
MSGTLSVRGIHMSFGSHVVLNDVSLTVAPGSRIGVVGPNGSGKTTLLRICAGLLDPEAGTVTRSPETMNVGWLPQEPDARPGETLLAYLARRTGVADAEAEVDRLADAMADDPDAVAGYTAALDRYVTLGGDDLPRRAEEVGGSLGLSGRLDQPMDTLSGGQRARAALAAILLSRFDVLLLDEPTNDLDFAGLERLEAFCASAAAGIAVVSHDRAFLDRVVSEVVELDDHSRTATTYSGGFESYLELKEVARRHAFEAWERNASERSDLEERARRVRAWSRKGVARAKRDLRSGDEPDKHIRTARTSSSEKIAAKARSLDRRLERMDVVAKPWEPWDLRMTLEPGKRSGDVAGRLSGAVIRRGSFLLGPIDVEVRSGERVAVLGPNGAGKTTLLGALLGRVPLESGERYLGPSVVVGEMSQERSVFSGPERLIDRFTEQTGLLAEEARTLLAKFGLQTDEVLRECGSLSPGERTRAVLAALMAGGTNLLVLDEPTNHLDLPAITELERALDTYTGTLLLVTHDRRLLSQVRIDRRIEL